MTDQPDDDGEDGSESERPSKKKKKRRAAVAPVSEPYDYRRRQQAGKTWTTGQVLAALIVGAAVGGLGGYNMRGPGQPSAAPPPQAEPAEFALGPRADPSAPAPPAAGAADKFGRPPGDQHYGHDHPPQDPGAAPGAPAAAPAAAPGPDGKDSFGRAAGNEHFGHNHP